MTQEDKDLLLKDLCARLPYGVMLNITHNKYTDETFNARLSTIDYCGEIKVRYGFEEYEQVFSLEQIKPYLRPMSSMTEEQKIDLQIYLNCRVFVNDEISFQCLYSNTMDRWKRVFEWCIKNHFDICGLIPKGLANDATGKNFY